MAGISFELRKLLAKRSFSSIVASFFYSTALAAGPWVISILAIIFAGVWVAQITGDVTNVRTSQVIITYIMALSLIASGPFQLLFSRYVSDRLFEKQGDRVLPNLLGALILSMFLGLFVSLLFLRGWLFELSPHLVILFTVTTVFASSFWVANTLLTSLKSYKYILFSFVFGFLLMVLLAPYFQEYSEYGFLYAYAIGFLVVYFLLLAAIFREFPSNRLLEFDFLKRNRVFYSLALSGLFYNLAIWIDKFEFWHSKVTGVTILGPFKASFIYDIPMFLAYLSIAPGMGFFFLKLEGEFAQHYQRYYDAVREGETLIRIFEIGYDLINSVRTFVQEVLRIQAVTLVIIFLLEVGLFKLFRLSLVYIPLFNILAVATSLQLLFIVVLSLLFYFDLRREALISTAIFLVTNALFTYVTLHLGPYFYGYGFLFSLLVSFVVALIFLRRFLYDVHYKTFMFA
ncbi:exopolysaccharide Pel transporter PelG [Thermovibrio ammonificans]